MAWDAGSRLKLKQLQEVGVVAVRYKAEGCNVELEVLSCVGKGVEYRFSSYSATDQKIAKSQRDLFTELPVGAARLGGKVGAGRALRTDYMLAGVLATPVMKAFPADKLEGDCDRATHVVGSMYVGGFAMATGASERLAAAATVFGVGAGADQQRSVERLAIEGDAAACAKAQRQGTREPACNVPLRIGLTPVEGRAAGGCQDGSRWNGSRCVSVESPELGYISGTVIDDDTLRAIEGAVIQLDEPTLPGLVTGTDGGFRSFPLRLRKYRLTITAPGYRFGQCEVEATRSHSAPNTAACRLSPLPTVGVIIGEVVEEATGNAVSGASVTITDKLRRNLSLSADSSGAFRFENVPPGAAWLTVEAVGFERSTVKVEVAPKVDTKASVKLVRRPKK